MEGPALRRAWTLLASMALALAMTLSLSLPPAEALAYDQPPKILRQAEWKALATINQLRADRGLRPLRMAHRVRLAARARSRDMRQHDYLSHVSPTGRDAAALLARRSIRYFAGSENIGRIHFVGWHRAAVGVAGAWFRSRGHRANLLSRDFNSVGIGAARDGDVVYWTAIFLRQQGRRK